MKPLTFIKWAWPIEEGLWLLFGFALSLFAHQHQWARFMEMAPAVQLMIGAQGAIAFGGPAIKRAQNGGRASTGA